jgi:hypothetical protein
MRWGNLTTNMFQTYAHLTGKDIDNEMLRTYRITVTENGEGGLSELRIEPRHCPHCKLINGPMAEFCNSCRRPLTELTAENEDDIHDSILKNMASLKRFIARFERTCGKRRDRSVRYHALPFTDYRSSSKKFPLPYTKININVKVGVPNEEFNMGSDL